MCNNVGMQVKLCIDWVSLIIVLFIIEQFKGLNHVEINGICVRLT
jgi:hypothetical protein